MGKEGEANPVMAEVEKASNRREHESGATSPAEPLRLMVNISDKGVCDGEVHEFPGVSTLRCEEVDLPLGSADQIKAGGLHVDAVQGPGDGVPGPGGNLMEVKWVCVVGTQRKVWPFTMAKEIWSVAAFQSGRFMSPFTTS